MEQNQITQTDMHSTTDMVLNHQAMVQMQNLATLMSGGKVTVPQHLQGSPADCMAIVMQAAQWKMNPYAVAQKTHLVNGNLGYEAQLVNAVISSSKAIEGRFHYEYGGNWDVNGGENQPYQQQQPGQNVNAGTTIDATCWVRVGAVLAGEKEIQWGEPLFPARVGVKNSPLWKSNPKQQAAYLATKYWARLYAPAVILGVYSTDELEVTPVQPEKEVNASPESKTIDSKTGEVLMPDYPQEKFEATFPKWEELVRTGKKTPQQIVSTIESKCRLSDEQLDQLLNLTESA